MATPYLTMCSRAVRPARTRNSPDDRFAANHRNTPISERNGEVAFKDGVELIETTRNVPVRRRGRDGDCRAHIIVYERNQPLLHRTPSRRSAPARARVMRALCRFHLVCCAPAMTEVFFIVMMLRSYLRILRFLSWRKVTPWRQKSFSSCGRM